MRTFRWNAPIIIGAGVFVFLSFAPAPLPLKAGESGAEIDVASDTRKLGLGRLNARLDGSDRVADIQALELCSLRARRWDHPRLAASGAGFGRSDQAGLGLPRQQGPRVPPRHLRPRDRHLSAADRSHCLPGARRLLVALGLVGCLDMSDVSGTIVAYSPSRLARPNMERA